MISTNYAVAFFDLHLCDRILCSHVRRIRGTLVPRFVDLLLQVIGHLTSGQVILSQLLVVACPTFCASKPHFSHIFKALGFSSDFCLAVFG